MTAKHSISLDKTLDWKIMKVSNKCVNSIHRLSETPVPSNTRFYEHAKLLHHTFTNILIWPNNTSYFNDGIQDWSTTKTSNLLEYSLKSHLEGNYLKGSFIESTISAKEATTTEFIMKKNSNK